MTINHIQKQSIKSLNLFSDPESINEISVKTDDYSDVSGDTAKKIFATLNYKEHTLLTLRAIEEMSYVELSQVMGKSPEALRKRYERLIIKLKKTFPNSEEV